jgi:hypothetical protein
MVLLLRIAEHEFENRFFV